MSASDRDRLLELIKDLAIVHGKVTLSSGKEADYYVDLRRVTLHGEAAPLVGRVMLDLTRDLSYDAVGGLTMGADPVATAMLHAAAAARAHAAAGVAGFAGSTGEAAGQPPSHPQATSSAQPGGTLDAFVVRKAEKAHGLQQRIEGPSIKGRRVLVLEDTSTTGGSPMEAIQACRAAGAEVVAVAVIADRASGAQERIEAAGVPYRAAYGLGDLGLS